MNQMLMQKSPRLAGAFRNVIASNGLLVGGSCAQFSITRYRYSPLPNITDMRLPFGTSPDAVTDAAGSQ